MPPLLVANEGKAFNVQILMCVELNILPHCSHGPPVEVLHFDKTASLAVLFDSTFNLRRKVREVLRLEFTDQRQNQNPAIGLFV